MKQIKKAAMISLISILSCTDVYAWGSKRPTPPPTPTPPSPPTIPTVPPAPTPNSSYIEQIKSVAASSSCAAYSWSSRGKAPAAYIKGMALNYARSYCRFKDAASAPVNHVNIMSAKAGDAAKDALAHYSSTFSNSGLAVNAAGIDSLRALWTLGVGLGMRESSGKYCEGRDMSASNTSASTAEAGMFQTSYDSISGNAELTVLYNEYKSGTKSCFLEVYKAGVSCSDTSNAGSGEGLAFQKLNKSCPAFAAEYAMMMLRVRRNHYGPINRKEAEVKNVCTTMLKSIESIIDNDMNACHDVL